MTEPLSEQRLQEIRERIKRAQDYRAAYAGADLPGVVGDDASALLAEVDRLRKAVDLLGKQLQGGALDVKEALQFAVERLDASDVDRFLKRERDEYEPRGECWNTVDDVLDAFRLHMVTGTPLTEPKPAEGPTAPWIGKWPMTEAEELRAANARLLAEVERQQHAPNEMASHFRD